MKDEIGKHVSDNSYRDLAIRIAIVPICRRGVGDSCIFRFWSAMKRIIHRRDAEDAEEF